MIQELKNLKGKLEKDELPDMAMLDNIIKFGDDVTMDEHIVHGKMLMLSYY